MTRPARIAGWMRTVRMRLALTYSGLVFGTAALVVFVVYLLLACNLDAAPLSSVALQKFGVSDDGWVKFADSAATGNGTLATAADLDVVQRAVNEQTLRTLRSYAAGALGGLFLFSLVVGWWVAGRVLRPLGDITRATREITGTDLSRRIDATGPPDELTTLADTIDEMLDRLEDAFAQQRNLIDDVSHELRNPVAVIRANVDAILADNGATLEQRHAAVRVVSRAAGDMGLLIEDLLAAARRRSGASTETEVDLPVLVRQTLEEYAVLIERGRLDLQIRLAPGPVVYADSGSLTRAIRNLLANAIRYTGDGRSIVVATGSTEGWAWFAVRDTGPGITDEDRPRIFDRYYAGTDQPNGAHARATHGNGGTGIGLAIARQIVEAHNGHLDLHTTVGDGSTFIIWLPDRAMDGPRDRRLRQPDVDPLPRVS